MSKAEKVVEIWSGHLFDSSVVACCRLGDSAGSEVSPRPYELACYVQRAVTDTLPSRESPPDLPNCSDATSMSYKELFKQKRLALCVRLYVPPGKLRRHREAEAGPPTTRTSWSLPSILFTRPASVTLRLQFQPPLMTT